MHWLKKVFAFVAVTSAFSIFALESSPSLTVTSQYKAETSYFNTWDNQVLYDPRLNDLFQLGLGAQLSFSKNDWQSIQYKLEPTFFLQKWFEAHLRLSRKIFLPETASFTHTLLFVKFQTPPLLNFRFFSRVGWYYRFWELNRASVFPIPYNAAYTEYDFALSLGLDYQVPSRYFGRFQISTFEDLDVYNLNHPFAELSGGLWITDFWTLSTFARYQVSLGFGRLDRFVFGVSMDFITDRYWD